MHPVSIPCDTRCIIHVTGLKSTTFSRGTGEEVLVSEEYFVKADIIWNGGTYGRKNRISKRTLVALLHSGVTGGGTILLLLNGRTLDPLMWYMTAPIDFRAPVRIGDKLLFVSVIQQIWMLHNQPSPERKTRVTGFARPAPLIMTH